MGFPIKVAKWLQLRKMRGGNSGAICMVFLHGICPVDRQFFACSCGSLSDGNLSHNLVHIALFLGSPYFSSFLAIVIRFLTLEGFKLRLQLTTNHEEKIQ
jgi:hypothetical protein